MARRLRPAVLVSVYVIALAGFVGTVVVRGGPSLGDAFGVVRPTTALSTGDLHRAAEQSVLPQPPGYALLAAPLVVAFRPLIGTPTWCDARVPGLLKLLVNECRANELASHRWYRSQAVLAIVAWAVLATGCVLLLRAAGAGGGVGEVFLVLALVAAPAASDGIVQTFHPQDLVCVGLSSAGVAAALRRRWVSVGVLFGIAFLCKQFALLPFAAVVVAAPDWRARLRCTGVAAGVVGAGVIPFAAVDPSGTWRTLSAVNAGGVVKVTTGTLLGMTGLSESTKLVVARDGPVVLALAMALWARHRARERLLSPCALIGLATACLAGRLVAEVWFASYYLLAVSAGLLVLDLAARRPPLLSVAWIALTGVLVERAGGIPTTPLAAALAFAASLVAVAIGLESVRRDGIRSGIRSAIRSAQVDG
jgi:hypothetical protein